MNKNYLGTVVYSKAGRDTDRKFIIMDIIDKEYVYICDGDLRKVQKPKKKKIKHLMFTETVAEDIKKSLISNVEVSNLQVRRFLQSLGTNKEV
ncbi:MULTISPECIES: KOW domain-containing RNA-binding protein [Clostridium]|jgi:ribosomal protein L14E/L6E/L27E|uniref:KOW domain-containing RNA-binding protein n=1 Tax=Clostridium TaxID=1485 RepID=UPI0002882D42|nr:MULTISPECIES: KOW domain-containing RNA-binding protein [Clostridium]